MMRVERCFSTPGTDPYDGLRWGRRDVTFGGLRAGDERRFEGVEFPVDWSDTAAAVVASRYFRAAADGAGRESSLRTLVGRVVTVYRDAGVKSGHLRDAQDADDFAAELTTVLLRQVMSFNSPVWFNVGGAGPQAVVACVVLSVRDALPSVRQWFDDELTVFDGGAGVGINLSPLRSSRESLSSGAPATGPLAFMRAADAAAGAIRSGRALRKPARMAILDVDHPDIEDFIAAKAREERKAHVLAAAGFDMDLDGADVATLQFQNANHSVRVSDEFMRAAIAGSAFPLRARTDGAVVAEVPASRLLRDIAEAAWTCGDPGLQFDDTINGWNPTPSYGRLTASNGCSEYLGPDNSASSIMSLNLMRFRSAAGGFDVERFTAAVSLAVTALDIGIDFADYPTPATSVVSRELRPISVGYANLAGLLMAMGIPYDAPAGREVAAAVTSLLAAAAYRRSAELAGLLGPYPRYGANEAAHRGVVERHVAAHRRLSERGVAGEVVAASTVLWQQALAMGAAHGWRNSLLTLIPPTGTVALMMDCATSGIEPAFDLGGGKKIIGGVVPVVNTALEPALRTLGYGTSEREAILAHVRRGRPIAETTELRPEHRPVFRCATGPLAMSADAQVDMVGAVQPFLSGGVSKTVNLPTEATVEDVERVFVRAWRTGLKAIAVYRDHSKHGQPYDR